MTRLRTVLTFLALVLLVLAAACSKKEDAGPVVDPPLLAFLSQARALHHEANVHEAAGEPARAIEALERLVSGPKPHPERTVPEVEEVLSDTYARLGELRLQSGNMDAAAAAIREGLAHAKEPTYFRGHLFEVSGIIEEARAASLADAGRADDAKRARERALDLLHEAVEIQNKVITDKAP
ncbi:hypothetical protein LZC95_16665 [Pendulispora brunnea]|uniref:MalT-like TPR region domain-containing protein n=1 Tax=Pendulispora brunnea TaxID=2905690 RepID=A0ABZ2KIF0_9BACT